MLPAYGVLNPRTTMHNRAHILFALTIVALLLFGCSKNYIPNTDVQDTERNREVISFCETYRKAVERRDIAKILKMVSPRYYEDGGNVDASDDLDYEGLKAFLKNEFQDSRAIRYEIRYRRVLWDEEVDRVYIDYTYSASFKIPGPEDKAEWKRKVAENRLALAKKGDSFEILSGL